MHKRSFPLWGQTENWVSVRNTLNHSTLTPKSPRGVQSETFEPQITIISDFIPQRYNVTVKINHLTLLRHMEHTADFFCRGFENWTPITTSVNELWCCHWAFQKVTFDPWITTKQMPFISKRFREWQESQEWIFKCQYYSIWLVRCQLDDEIPLKKEKHSCYCTLDYVISSRSSQMQVCILPWNQSPVQSSNTCFTEQTH